VSEHISDSLNCDIGLAGQPILHERFLVTEEGLQIRVLEQPGDEPSVLLVHGLADSADVWRSAIAKFPRSTRLFAIDLPGHGKSDRLYQRSYEVESISEAALSAFKLIGTKRCVLIGHSLGAEVVVRIAAERPQDISGIGLIDCSFDLPDEARVTVDAALAPLFRSYASVDEYANALQELLPIASPELVRSYAKHMLVETERELFQLRTDPEVLNLLRVGRPNTLDDWVTRTLRAVGCSVLIARGAYSGVLSISSARNLAARLGKRGRVEIVPVAGHNIPLDQPEYLGRLMSSFVDEIKASCQT